MNTTDHLSQDDLALFALQSLPEAEMAAALAHLQGCDPCRDTVAEFQGDLGMYALSFDRGYGMDALPAGARERFLRRVSEEKRTAASNTPSESHAHTNGASPAFAARTGVLRMPFRASGQRPRAGLVSWTGWALAAGFAGLAALQSHERQQELHARQQVENALSMEHTQLTSLRNTAAVSQVAVSTLTDFAALNVTLRETASHTGTPAQIPQAHATYLADRGALVFVASNMEPLKPYKVYELWLLPTSADQSPIPAASFRPDPTGNAQVILPTGPKLLSIKGFGVTVEDDKAPPQKPTLPILMAGSSKA